jgi:HK97 family phage prohead protease
VNDFVSWDSSGGRARGQIERIVRDGEINVPDSDFTITGTEDDPAALIRVYRRDESDDAEMEWEETDTLVGHKFSTLTKIEPLGRSIRQVDLVAPAYMRAAARQGLRYYEQGLAGDGLADRTVTEARQMARGDALTPDKWVRTAAWIARHLVDLDAPAANPEADGYPSPGVVAHLLWGSGPSRRAANRAMEYAEGVVGRLEEENDGRARGEAVKKLETRTNQTSFEIRELEGSDGMTFEGYASVFNSESEDLGGFREVVAPGAFKRSLRSRNDIKLLWNHDTGAVLGSTRAGTVTLVEDERGLKVRAQLPNTTLGRDTAELIRRGDVDSMSFGFSVIKDTWDETGTNRTLNAVRLHECSVVAFPAYGGTAGTTIMRGLDKVAKRANVDADELADALLKLEEGGELSMDEANMLSRVVDELKPAAQDVEPTANNDMDMLLLKKKKLELMEKY